MNRKNQNKRREFLNNVCPTVALAFMGVTMLEACSSGGDDSDMGKKLSQKEKQLIHKSIDEVEEKILELKIIIDKN